MASLIENLIQILDEELECYTNELNIANQKTDIIVKDDFDALQIITKAEQQIAGRIVRLEKQRQQVINDIGLVLNRDKEELTIAKLASLLENSLKEQKKLYELKENIINVVTELKNKNEENRKLIEHSLEYIDFTINALQSARTMQDNNYEGKGQTIDRKQSTHYFDAKQ